MEREYFCKSGAPASSNDAPSNNRAKCISPPGVVTGKRLKPSILNLILVCSMFEEVTSILLLVAVVEFIPCQDDAIPNVKLNKVIRIFLIISPN